MPAQNLNPFDAVPPRRPAVDLDFNGAAKVNPTNFTDAPVYPNADHDNTRSRLAVSVGSVMPHTIATIDPGTSITTPVLLMSAISAYRIGQTVPYTLARHSMGDAHGDFDLTWAQASFPAPVADVEACLTGAGDATISCAAITGGVRIRTRVAGTGTDIRFQIRHF